ncbi:uncharacterized protein LOC106661876 [Cimex lectularius]|uniref:Uncharacterized protein n=1 Tax=Cimex lectularius TaxID=79782 RepID=A0A8I6RAU4_CIMLE|nr:uncharacterized protein LOC106661876 [Cimex lectularius]XP_014241088.1 uncharacterized protein LOC106661876 [Cimex lectularius]XP_014241089.1 uncharacterized protein LOC106661876 [Cimex lectularius]
MSSSDGSLPISLPQWMKAKINDRYDLDQTAFSPPSNDDDFFSIRYKKSTIETETKITDSKLAKPLTSMVASKINPSQFVDDPSQHTIPCQQFIPRAKISPREIGMRHGVDPPLGRAASTGIDDGFTGEGAACGYSVVAVAHQMLAERKGDKLAPPRIPSQRVRRNSKSLPASPQSSPKMLRKNPYFTEILFGSSDLVDTDNNNSQMTKELAEKWSSKFGRTFSDSDPTSSPSTVQPVRTLKAKPSELREMNFWSPTSM